MTATNMPMLLIFQLDRQVERLNAVFCNGDAMVFERFPWKAKGKRKGSEREAKGKRKGSEREAKGKRKALQSG